MLENFETLDVEKIENNDFKAKISSENSSQREVAIRNHKRVINKEPQKIKRRKKGHQ